MRKSMNILSAIVLAGTLAACNSPAENLSGSGNGGGEISGEKNVVKAYVTTSDRSHLFTEKDLEFNRPASMSPYIVNLDFDRTYQTVDGFGAAVTGATSYNLMKMQQEDRTAFLKDIFDREEGLGSSLIRVSIGASDFPAGRKEFTWCDTEGIENFAPHSDDVQYLIPVLKEIYAINPDVKIIGSPWSAPVWMKESASWTSASLKPEYYDDYAQYFVKWIQYMESQGFDIYAVTPQNEPLNKGNSMSMYMGWQQQRDFIKQALGPAFRDAGIDTKILVFDHNFNYDNIADQIGYPLHIYEDPDASQYVAGSAWHSYGGNVSELDQIIYEYPDKEIYFTEASIGAWNYTFENCLVNDFETIFIGTLSRMGKGVTLWNLLLDDKGGPYGSAGACTTCYGAVDISSSDYRTLTYRTHYYNIAHASKVIMPGAVRIGTEGFELDGLDYLAFRNPDGSIGVIIVNKNTGAQTLTFNTDEYSVNYEVPGRSLVSLSWNYVK